MRRVFILFFAIVSISCSDFMENSMECREAGDIFHIEKINGEDSLLTLNDASIVARLEKFGDANTKSNDEKSVKDVLTVTNKDGNPIIYAVNFEGGGYILVSATKKYYPILAKSEDGYFSDEMYNSSMDVLLDEYEVSIGICENQPKDSLVKIRALWNKYEEFKPKRIIQTKSDALFDLVSSSIEQWNAQGIQYYFLNEGCPNFLTESEYQNYVSLASEYGNPNYDYMQNSVILVQTSNRYSSKGPLTSTCWQQYDIFNDKIYDVYGVNYPAGCAAIAIGQLMSYHRYPTNYNWGNILSGVPSDVSNLVFDIAEGVETDYQIGSSGASIANAKAYLDSIGYHTQLVDHTPSMVQQSLHMNKHLYI